MARRFSRAPVRCVIKLAVGAPIVGDKADWAPRIAQGTATLHDHAIKGFTGALVVLERETGRVLAMASSPGFDANMFASGNPNGPDQVAEVFQRFDTPLLNRTTQGQYPLGSVFKIITMAAYDVLMAYSGGKDSTYTMSLLRNKYDLRVLALSFDNGFLSPAAAINIKNVTDSLGVDHILFKPHWGILKKIFVAAADRELYSKKTLEVQAPSARPASDLSRRSV